MAIPVLHCYTTAVAGNVDNISVNKPTSGSSGPDPKDPEVGDLLVILVGNDNTGNTQQWNGTTDFPTGFTFINHAGDSTRDCHVGAFYRVVDGTEGSSFNTPAASFDECWTACLLISGVDTTSPLNVTGADSVASSPSSGTPLTISSATTTVADCLAIAVAAFDGSDDGGFTWGGTGWTEIAEVHNGTSANNAAGTFAQKDVASAGAIGAATVYPAVTDGMVGFMFAFAGASGAGAQTITPTGVASDEAFGTTVLSPGAVSVSPSGVASDEAFGTAFVSAPITISATGIASAEAFGAASFSLGAVSVLPSGVASAEAFGTAALDLNITGSDLLNQYPQVGLSVTDDFNRADGTTLAEANGWASTSVPTSMLCETFNNRCQAKDTLAPFAGQVRSAQHSASSDTGLELSLTVYDWGTSNAFVMLWARSDSTDLSSLVNEGYSILVGPDYWLLSSTGPSNIYLEGYPPSSLPNGTKIALRLFGDSPTTISAWIQRPSGGWEKLVETTDSDFPDAGYSGFILYNALDQNQKPIIEDFYAASLSPISSGVASAEAFGTASVSAPITISATGIAGAEAFGTHTLSLGAVTLTPSGIAGAEAFGTHTLSPGVVTLTPTGVAGAEAFGTAVLSSAFSISPTGIAGAEAFGTHTLSPGVVTVSPTGVAGEEVFGTHTLIAGAVSVSPSGIVGEEAFGTHTLTVGAIVVSPTGVVGAEAFGTATLSPGVVLVLPSGIAGAESFGTAVLSSVFTISPTGIASAEAFGTHTLVAGAVSVSVTGIDSLEAFGSTIVASGVSYILPDGIAGEEAFGTVTLSPGVVLVLPSGIAGAEVFGTHTVTPGVVLLAPSGVVGVEEFGTHVLSTGAATIVVTGIAGAEAFGSHTVSPGAVLILPSSIGSEEFFEEPVLTVGQLGLLPSGISSAETFGSHTLSPGVVLVLPTGIGSTEDFGTAAVYSLYSILPSGIISSEIFGSQVVSVGDIVIQCAGVSSVETIGSVVVVGGLVYYGTLMLDSIRCEPSLGGTIHINSSMGITTVGCEASLSGEPSLD